MKVPKKRIGLILASIHTGSSLNLWTSLAAEAERAGAAFFIFPGGRLDSQLDSEYLRNSAFKLANRENLDGLISWGSSIGGAVTLEELNRFHAALEPLPYVTIGHKISGHPCVKFDSYTGMKALVSHFINDHGKRKIAFIRGPANHVSARERYLAYRDALAEASLPAGEHEPLVSDPFPWSEGEAAAVQLRESRRLVPGQDFEVLIGASDMMIFSAVQYLEKSGFRVPRDFLCGGFNDSAESRLLSCPLSTVHMPYAELGLAASRMIRTLLSGPGQDSPSREDADLVLPSEIVLRESCGCKNNPPDSLTPGQSRSIDAPAEGSDLFHALTDVFRLDDTDQNAVLQPLMRALQAGDAALFIDLFERTLVRFYEEDRETRLLLRGIDLVKGSGYFDPEFLARVERLVFQKIAQVQGRVLALKTYETGIRHGILNSLKCDLLCARDRRTLIGSLSVHLPKTGIHTCSLVMYWDDEHSQYIGGFSPAGENSGNGELFPSKNILPSHIIGQYGSGVFIVQPLFMENQSLGYVVCNTPFFDGNVFEELRSAISSALKGIFLFEEATAAKREAEQAERTQTEFFAYVGNDLCDPLTGIEDNLLRIEESLAGTAGDAGGLRGQIRVIREQISAQIDRTNRLMDLTLSQVNELTFEKTLFRIAELFPDEDFSEDPEYPLLYGDLKRYWQAYLLLREDFDAGMEVKVSAAGLRVTLEARKPPPDTVREKNELLLAEKLILLQYGEFSIAGSICHTLIPWPNLAGLPPPTPLGPGSGILELSDDLPLEDFQLPRRKIHRHESLSQFQNPEENLILAWNPDRADPADWLWVYDLRHHPKLFRAPFLAYSRTFSGKGLISVIENRVREKRKGPILFVSGKTRKYELWAPRENSLQIASMEAFPRTVDEIAPSIVVFTDFDAAAVRQVRRHPETVLAPILVLPETIRNEEEVLDLCSLPLVLLCNQGIASSPEFAGRVRSLLSGGDILPPHTGALVKKAILYFNLHAASQIARWKLAYSVNVSEDYLTRIFHKEIGLSPWEYLTRYRVFLASGLLLHTDDPISEIAERTGFQDQAYFCRVFKKINGFPPGKFRSRS